jgi:hypothetical protein
MFILFRVGKITNEDINRFGFFRIVFFSVPSKTRKIILRKIFFNKYNFYIKQKLRKLDVTKKSKNVEN